jgi:hypothetical protein
MKKLMVMHPKMTSADNHYLLFFIG